MEWLCISKKTHDLLSFQRERWQAPEVDLTPTEEELTSMRERLAALNPTGTAEIPTQFEATLQPGNNNNININCIINYIIS